MNIDLPEYLSEPVPLEQLRLQYGELWFIAKKVVDQVVMKTRLAEAQNHRCAYCGTVTNNRPGDCVQATIEHVVPKARQGRDHWLNYVMACQRCNNKRDKKFIAEEVYVQTWFEVTHSS